MNYGIVKRLDKYISNSNVNGYYETVFAEIIVDGSLSSEIVSFDGKLRHEIDTIENMVKAEKLFLSGNYTTTKIITVSHPNIFSMELFNAATSPQGTTGILSVAI